MGIITRMRKQKAVYWAFLATYSSSGEPQFDAPVEIDVRWEESKEASEDPGLREVLRFAATAYVDRDMKLGDYLMLGSKTSSTDSDPRKEKSWEVLSFSKVPNIKATEYLRSTNMAPSHLKLLDLHGRGVEAVTYKRVTAASVTSAGVLSQTTTSTSVTAATRDRPTTSEVEMSRGRLRQTDEAWELPKALVPSEPGLEDWILDKDGVRWDVVGWGEGTLRSWWRVFARRGS